MAHASATHPTHVPEVQEAPGARLVSLDAFRGLVIATMILVNSSGGFPGSYGPLLHADWHGWTITDVVFPSFLWIVGLTLTLSLGKRMAAGTPRRDLVVQILRRGAILYGLGLFLYGFPWFDLSTLRFLGVLQRIAICYVAASLLFVFTSRRAQMFTTAALLSTYWLVMAFAPVPGYGAGRLDVEGNFAHYVDKMVLGRHNYAATKTWDPEGIVSTLPAIASSLFGVMAAYLLRLKRTLAERTAWLFLAGNVLLAAGLMLDVWLPINKKLWTSSFAVFMAGFDFVLFAACLWLIDGNGYKRVVKPFVILGMNAIAIYMISELGEVLLTLPRDGAPNMRDTIHGALFAPFFSPANASLLYSLSYVGLMLLIAWFLYRRKWFIRV